MTTAIDVLQSPIVRVMTEAFGWTLIHFVWQGALVALVLWCVLALMSRRSADARYAVACVALLALVALPAITFVRLTDNEYRSLNRVGAVVSATVVVNVGAEGAEPAGWTRLIDRVDQNMPWLMLAWGAGVLVFSCRLGFGMATARQLKLRDTEIVSQRLQQMFDRLRFQVGFRRAVTLFYSARVQVPTVIGWLKPVVLVPASCLTGLSEVQVEALLAHELAHICRNDYLVSVLQSVVETVLFYHPAVWWVSNQVRREREYCCDDMAVGVCGDKVAYARALSLLEERRALLPEMGLGANGGVLTMRIKRLLGYREEIVSSNMAWIVVLAVVITGTGSIVGRLAYAESNQTTAQAAESPRAASETQADAAKLEAEAAEAETQAQEMAEQSSAMHKQVENAQRDIAQSEKDSQNLSAADRKQLDEARKQVQDALKKLNTDELKKGLEQVRQQVNSPEFKKQIEAASVAASKINSVELRKQLEHAQKQIANSRVIQEQIQQRLNSPEFRKQMQQARAAAAKVNSPEFRKQMEELKKQSEQFNTLEFRDRIKHMADEARQQSKAAEQMMARNADAPPPPPAPESPTVDGPRSSPNDPVRVSSATMAGQAVSQPPPIYPQEARDAHIQGTVVLKAIVGKTGNVEKLSVVSGPKELLQSAVAAVSQWKYKPYLLNGQPVEVQTTINVNYTFGGSDPAPDPKPQASAAPSSVDQPIALIYKVQPEYTVEAKAAKVQGPVVLNVTVKKDGLPTNVHVIRSVDPGLDENAVAVVKQYRFRPAMKNGQPIETAVNVEVNYRIF